MAVTDAGAKMVQRRVLGSEADFGVTSKWADDPGLEFRPLLGDRFGVVCRGDNPLAAHLAPLDTLAFRELAEPTLEREICVITRRARVLSPAAESMLGMIAQQLRTYALPRGVRLV